MGPGSRPDEELRSSRTWHSLPLRGPLLRDRAAGLQGPALLLPSTLPSLPCPGVSTAATRADGSRGLHGNTDVKGLSPESAFSAPSARFCSSPGPRGVGAAALPSPSSWPPEAHGVNWAGQASPCGSKA